MKICKVKPDHDRCCACIDIQVDNNIVEDCNECELRNREYELISVGNTFWYGDYAMVAYDGKIEKVSLDRVYDLKEK